MTDLICFPVSVSYSFREMKTNETPVRYGTFRRPVTKTLKAYEIIVNGVVVGIVMERMVTFERKTAGRMYVNSRWRRPRWFAERLGQLQRHRGGGSTTRKWEVEQLLRSLQEDLKKTEVVENDSL